MTHLKQQSPHPTLPICSLLIISRTQQSALDASLPRTPNAVAKIGHAAVVDGGFGAAVVQFEIGADWHDDWEEAIRGRSGGGVGGRRRPERVVGMKHDIKSRRSSDRR